MNPRPTGQILRPQRTVGGSGYNYTSCTNLTGGIPDPYTGKFDTIGAFSEPSQVLLHLQVSYDITPRISLVANLANIVNTCFGGTRTAFTVKGACDYNVVANGATGAVGNTYNPGLPDPTLRREPVPAGVDRYQRVELDNRQSVQCLREPAR